MKLKLPSVLDEAWLWELDKIRLDHPRAVVRVLERAAPEITECLLPLLYAVAGAACRQLERLLDARWMYRLAEEYAEGDPAMVALITHRRAWIEASDGKLPKAITQMRCAAGMFSELGYRNSVGKTLVDRGVLFYHLERFEHSTACLQAALAHLGSSEFENRYTAKQVCALNSRALRNYKESVDWLTQAKELLPMCSAQAKERFRWLYAECLVEAGQCREGAAEYLKIEEFYRETEWFREAALAKAVGARALLAAGDFSEAAKVAESLEWYIFRVNSKTAQAALIDVGKAAAEGQLASGLRQATQTLSALKKLGR